LPSRRVTHDGLRNRRYRLRHWIAGRSMQPMTGILIAAAGISGFLAVAAGAFGAHALKDSLSPDLARIYETAVLYHLIHSVALLGIVPLARAGLPLAGPAGIAFAIGIVVFSGSLYALALTGARGLGAITPIGGVAFLAAWGMLVWTGLTYRGP
jgi:uncharacterized membrane protein YgdD (TMEM256/DUF423 family)